MDYFSQKIKLLLWVRFSVWESFGSNRACHTASNHDGCLQWGAVEEDLSKKGSDECLMSCSCIYNWFCHLSVYLSISNEKSQPCTVKVITGLPSTFFWLFHFFSLVKIKLKPVLLQVRVGVISDEGPQRCNLMVPPVQFENLWNASPDCKGFKAPVRRCGDISSRGSRSALAPPSLKLVPPTSNLPLQ